MKLITKEHLLVAIRSAVVLAGVGVGLTMPPPGVASEAPGDRARIDASKSMDSFASIAKGRAALSEKSGVRQRILDEVDSGPLRYREDESRLEPRPESDSSFKNATVDTHAIDDSAHFDRGDGRDHFRGGGWPYEREYFNNRSNWTPAVPEIRATTLTLVGVIALALMAGRKRRRRMFWAH